MLIHLLVSCFWYTFISEPIFVDAHVIPDGTDPNDAKIYFFFKERLTDNSGSTKQIHSMIARICPVRTILIIMLWDKLLVRHDKLNDYGSLI